MPEGLSWRVLWKGSRIGQTRRASIGLLSTQATAGAQWNTRVWQCSGAIVSEGIPANYQSDKLLSGGPRSLPSHTKNIHVPPPDILSQHLKFFIVILNSYSSCNFCHHGANNIVIKLIQNSLKYIWWILNVASLCSPLSI